MSPTMATMATGTVEDERALPGTAKMGAKMFGLRDKTMGPPPDRALKAKNEVIYKYKPDRLETKPAAYNLSNYVEQNKFTLRHQEQKLCNTIHPVTFKPRTEALDHTLFAKSTIKHPPAHLGGHAVESITFTKEEFAGPWKASTVQSYKDFAAAQQAFDEKSQAATMKKTTKLLGNKYTTPTERETAKMEEMRRKKREQLEYIKALEATYGREGAVAMMKAEEESKNSNRHRGKFTQYDREAIKELDTFDPTKPGGKGAPQETEAADQEEDED